MIQMWPRLNKLSLCLAWLVLIAVGCSWLNKPALSPTQVETVQVIPSLPAQITPDPTKSPGGSERLSADQATTLSSLELVDDYPLYVMHYHGTYLADITGRNKLPEVFSSELPKGYSTGACNKIPWGCSLFAALGDGNSRLYGRNFDWEYSPALLLVYEPPDGYASLSIVDIAFLGYTGSQAQGLLGSTLDQRIGLLDAPGLPFDGMNERGLVVGMAAVPEGNMQPDPNKPTIGSLGVMREMLDHAQSVSETVRILESYNIDDTGGPPVHYLVADASGQAALIEFYDGKLIVTTNQQPWHLATNFLVASTGSSPEGQCWRYDRLSQALTLAGGRFSVPEAIKLLDSVKQDSTQWSVVYNMTNVSAAVVIGQDYAQVYTFELNQP